MIYEVIVIGAGVEGSATGYYLTSRGTKNVLILEQFDARHTRGSSHGGSRIAHIAYTEPFYVEMMKQSFEMWKEIEEKSGKNLFIKTGVLGFGTSSVNHFSSTLQSNNIHHKIMTGREANKIYSNQLQLPDEYMCVFAEDAGMIRAAHAVATLQELFVKFGGTLLDNHRVTGVIPGGIITVETDKGIFKAKKVIVAAGAWTNLVLEGTGLTLPIKPVRVEALYWSTSNPDVFTPDSFPVFLYINEDEYFEFYGLPIKEYHGLIRIAYHHGNEISDPERRDNDPHSKTSQMVSQFIQKHFKGVSVKPAIMELCMYTITPDSNPFMDRHPLHPNIVIATGFSGKGFKFAPVIGKMLSELALGHPPSNDLSPFKIDRFKNSRSRL